MFFIFFFFQAEDGIRDHCVTGVQTCALPIWTKRSIAIGAVHGLTLHEHGGDDGVAARCDVGQKLVEQVPPARSVPQVMVGVDDRQVWINRRLTATVEPVLAYWKIIAVGWARHCVSPLWRGRPSRPISIGLDAGCLDDGAPAINLVVH